MAELVKFLPLISILCGVSNVLIIKWIDTIEAEDATGIKRRFQHPVLQTAIMFLGQIICLGVYKVALMILSRREDDSENINLITNGNREFSPSIFILPSFFDVIASTMLFSALYITNASSWQMLRVVSLIFVSLYGAIYLNQNLKMHHWFAMIIIIIGLIIIVVFDVNYSNYYDSKAILTADLLIICSQIFQSHQYIYEEKIVKTLDIAPMQAIGWQGVFGFFQSLLLLIPVNFIKIDPPFNNNSNGAIDYLPDAINQLLKNSNLVVGHVVFLFSVALYNYSSITVMKNTSSKSRIMIDWFRAIPIYVLSVLIQLETLSATIILAFLILLSGIFTYKNIVFTQIYIWFLRRLTQRTYNDIDVQENVINSPADSVEA